MRKSGVVEIVKGVVPVGRKLTSAVVAAVMRAPAPQSDELSGLLHWQQPQQHLIDQGENRGIGADTERQRKHRDDNENRGFLERTKCESNVLSKVSHVGQYSPDRGTLQCLGS
jgi:hypothetical protein